MLTVSERKALDFIALRLNETGGVAPSYDEIAYGIGLSSKSRVGFILEGLERKGRLRRMGPRKQRALEIIPQAKPVVHYTDAAYFTWDDEAQELRPWLPQT